MSSQNKQQIIISNGTLQHSGLQDLQSHTENKRGSNVTVLSRWKTRHYFSLMDEDYRYHPAWAIIGAVFLVATTITLLQALLTLINERWLVLFFCIYGLLMHTKANSRQKKLIQMSYIICFCYIAHEYSSSSTDLPLYRVWTGLHNTQDQV